MNSDASFFPGLSLSGFLASLIRLPAALGQHPAFAPGRLNQQYIVLIGSERYDASDETFALSVVTYIKRKMSVMES